MAEEEARKWNHEYVGTEHLLLAMINEGSGVAAFALRAVSGDLGRIQRGMENLMVRGTAKPTRHSLPMTPRAQRAIEYANGAFYQDYVFTEHLLLGLLADNDGLVPSLLMSLGIEPAAIREELRQLLRPGPKSETDSDENPYRPPEEQGYLTLQEIVWRKERNDLIALWTTAIILFAIMMACMMTYAFWFGH